MEAFAHTPDASEPGTDGLIGRLDGFAGRLLADLRERLADDGGTAVEVERGFVLSPHRLRTAITATPVALAGGIRAVRLDATTPVADVVDSGALDAALSAANAETLTSRWLHRDGVVALRTAVTLSPATERWLVPLFAFSVRVHLAEAAARWSQAVALGLGEPVAATRARRGRRALRDLAALTSPTAGGPSWLAAVGEAGLRPLLRRQLAETSTLWRWAAYDTGGHVVEVPFGPNGDTATGEVLPVTHPQAGAGALWLVRLPTRLTGRDRAVAIAAALNRRTADAASPTHCLSAWIGDDDGLACVTFLPNAWLGEVPAADRDVVAVQVATELFAEAGRAVDAAHRLLCDQGDRWVPRGVLAGTSASVLHGEVGGAHDPGLAAVEDLCRTARDAGTFVEDTGRSAVFLQGGVHQRATTSRHTLTERGPASTVSLVTTVPLVDAPGVHLSRIEREPELLALLSHWNAGAPWAAAAFDPQHDTITLKSTLRLVGQDPVSAWTHVAQVTHLELIGSLAATLAPIGLRTDPRARQYLDTGADAHRRRALLRDLRKRCRGAAERATTEQVWEAVRRWDRAVVRQAADAVVLGLFAVPDGPLVEVVVRGPHDDPLLGTGLLFEAVAPVAATSPTDALARVSELNRAPVLGSLGLGAWTAAEDDVRYRLHLPSIAWEAGAGAERWAKVVRRTAGDVAHTALGPVT